METIEQLRRELAEAREEAANERSLHYDAMHEIHKLLEPRKSIGDSEMMQLLRRVNRDFELEIAHLRKERAALLHGEMEKV